MTPKSIQKSIKKSLKNQSISALNLAPIFNTVWDHSQPSRPLIFELSPAREANFHIFASSQTIQKLSKTYSKNSSINKNQCKISSKINQKTMLKKITKIHQKSCQNGAKMAPGISRNFPETVPRATQKRKDSPKRHQEHPRDPHQAARASQGTLQGPFQAAQGAQMYPQAPLGELQRRFRDLPKPPREP